MRQIYKGILMLATILCASISFNSVAAASKAIEQPRNPFTGTKLAETEIMPSKIQGSAVKPLARNTQSQQYFNLVLSENHLLSQEVTDWAHKEGYKLLWNSKRDYVIYNTITISGKKPDDIFESLGDLFSSENYGLVIKLYQKNNVILIDEQ